MQAIPSCPITGLPATRRIQPISARLISELWRRAFGVKTERQLAGIEQFGLWESPCGLAFFDPMLEGDEAFYLDLYRRGDFHRALSVPRIARPEFRRIADLLRPRDKVLDVGCGEGALARHLPHATYVGLDPHCYAKAAELDVRNETIATHAASHPEEYDAVCAFHSIEHVADPLDFTRDLVKCVRVGGRLCIVVPSRTSPLTEIPNFVLNAPPHHLTWWDEGALRAVADRLDLDDGSDRNGALFVRQPHLLDGSMRSQTDWRSIFPSTLDMVLRTRLELAHRPRRRCIVSCSGVGKAFGIAPHRPQAVVMAWIATAVAVFYSLSSVALALLFFTRMQVLDDRLSASVALVLPATGALPGIEDLLAALTAQSLRPRRLIVSVEAREDPAYPRVAALAERYPELNVELVVAGLSPLRSQKCTNLLAALAQLDADDAYIVLLDADIRPQPWWLAMLVAPLAAGRADLVNGYRWPVPTRMSLGTVLVTAIDRAVAVLPRVRWTRSAWGGSLAFTRNALAALDLPNTIGHALTEDLPIGDRAAQTGLRVLTRRAIRPPTPTRRQSS